MKHRKSSVEALHDLRSDAAFAAVVQPLAAEIDRQLAQVLGSDDATGPHKARVALRRLTTALDVFAPILHRKRRARLRARAKRVFRLLGTLRDADVFLAGLRAQGAAVNQDRIDAVAQETDALRQSVRKSLRRDRAVALAPAVLRDVAAGRLLKTGKPGVAARARPARDLGAKALDATWALGLAYGADLTLLPEETRHDFRKDMKSLRYTAEFFAGHWSGPMRDAFHAALEALQEELGLLNDLAVARAMVEKGQGNADKAPEAPLGAGLAGQQEEQALLARAQTLWTDLRAKDAYWRGG